MTAEVAGWVLRCADESTRTTPMPAHPSRPSVLGSAQWVVPGEQGEYDDKRSDDSVPSKVRELLADGRDDLELLGLRLVCHEVIIVTVIFRLIDVFVECNLLM